MSTQAKDVAKDKNKGQPQSQATPAAAAPAAPARKERTRDPWLSEKEAIIKAWKDAGNKGIPEHVKVKDFKRVGNRRLADAVHALELLANLGNRSSYSYTDDQVAKIMSAVADKVEALERAFAAKGDSAPTVEL